MKIALLIALLNCSSPMQLFDVWQFPPHRLLAINLILSRWMGWQRTPEKLYLVSGWERIENSYDKGRNAYTDYKM
ncbi:MAG TPA: hypothetical protein VE130_08085 [Nitrososphaeraceae archaeon]|nr:hypothetical protein [Nitrososphaeraceae archaeon]